MRQVTGKQEEADAALILAEGPFDLPLYEGERALDGSDLTAAVREYSAIAGKYDYLRAPIVHQACTRRPLTGFHTVAYALQNRNYDPRRGSDPLARYLQGAPKALGYIRYFELKRPITLLYF